MHPLKQEQIKRLFSYNFHHLDANSKETTSVLPIWLSILALHAVKHYFGRKYDLRRHKNIVHSEDVSSGDEDSRSEDFESENEEWPEVEMSESETLSNVDLEDNVIYQRWYERSMQVSKPARTEKYEKCVGAGIVEKRVREKAYERTLWATKTVA